jgi:hypothetical protein
MDVLMNNGTEACPFNTNPRVDLSADLCYLVANVFTLAIAVGPNHQCIRTSSPHFDILDELCDGLFVFDLYGRVEQDERITGVPFAVCLGEVEFSDMPRNISDGESLICLRIIEGIVACATESILKCNLSHQDERKWISRRLTVSKRPPESISVIERAIEGFSATQSTLMVWLDAIDKSGRVQFATLGYKLCSARIFPVILKLILELY